MAEIPTVVFGSSPSWMTATATSSAAVDKLRNNGLMKLYIRNNGTGDRTVTVKEQRACNYGHTTVNYTVICGAGQITRAGTFRKDRYNSKEGKIEIWADTAEAIGLLEYAGVQEIEEMGR